MFGATHETDTEEETPPDDRDASAMERARRRQIRRVVKAHDGPMTLDQLTDEIYRWELHRSATRVSRPDVRERLFHVELPALDHVGDADCDLDRGVIASTETVASGSLIDAAPERAAATPSTDERIASGYLLAYLVAVGLFAATAFGVGPFAAVPTVLALAVGLAAFGVAAALDG